MNEILLRHLEDENIHSVGYGEKVRGGAKTGEMGVIFHVFKKLPLAEVDSRRIIPASMTVEGSELVTDVVEDSPPELIGCKDWVPGQKVIDGCPQGYSCYGDGTLASEEQNSHRVKVRPVLGGMSVTEQSKNGGSIGTMGCMVRDNEDGSIVALTNAHVVLSCPLDPIQHPRFYVENSRESPVVQPATYETWDGTSGSLPQDPLSNRIGLVKRSSFYNFGLLSRFGGWTVFIDAALIHVDPGTLNSSSSLIKGFESFGSLQFASTQEIDSLLSGSNDIYVSGRTTGAKGGPSCRVTVTENVYVMSIFLKACGQDWPLSSVNFYEILKIRYLDGSPGVVVPGDSGSVALADFSGTKKIVGLVFAAGGVNYSDGFFCRIDRVASEMNISAWDGTQIKYADPTKWEYITRDVVVPDPEITPPSTPENLIVVGGKKYWRVGSEKIT